MLEFYVVKKYSHSKKKIQSCILSVWKKLLLNADKNSSLKNFKR